MGKTVDPATYTATSISGSDGFFLHWLTIPKQLEQNAFLSGAEDPSLWTCGYRDVFWSKTDPISQDAEAGIMDVWGIPKALK